jgi:hypothetical protein
MKKTLFIIASSLSILTMSGCKKETESQFAYLLKEKIWTGTLQYDYYGYPEPFAGDYYFNQQNGTMRVSGGSEKAFFVIFPDGETIWMMGNFGNGMLKKSI